MTINNKLDILEIMRADNSKMGMPFNSSNWAVTHIQSNNLEQDKNNDDIASGEMNTRFSAYPPDPKYHKAWQNFLHRMISARMITTHLQTTRGIWEACVIALYNYCVELDSSKDKKITKISAYPTKNQVEYRPDSTREPIILTWDLVLSMYHVIVMSRHIPGLLEEKKVVVDLGAGWGRVGYILKKANPKLTYVVCDLPESLMASMHYLPITLPDELSFDYVQNKKIESFSRKFLEDEPCLRFMGSQDILKFDDKSIDVLINIASFGEMPQECIKKYFDIIDKKSNFLYTFQYGRQLVGKCGSGFNKNDYPYLSNWKRIHYDEELKFYVDGYFDALFEIS